VPADVPVSSRPIGRRRYPRGYTRWRAPIRVVLVLASRLFRTGALSIASAGIHTKFEVIARFFGQRPSTPVRAAGEEVAAQAAATNSPSSTRF